MAQVGRAGESEEKAAGDGSLGEEGFGLHCDEKEGASWAGGRQNKRK